MSRALEVLAPGPLATVQDLGRPGFAAVGVGRSGVADRASAALANRLVGNRPEAAVVEATFGGLRVRAVGGDLLVAVSGAGVGVRAFSRSAAVDAPFLLAGGCTLELTPPERGLRSYLAVRGGVDVEPVLGSRSTDVLSGLGPAPLRAGDRLPVGTLADPGPAGRVLVDLAPVPGPEAGDVRLAVRAGPREDWFSPQALGVLTSGAYEVTSDSNRIGLRLRGEPLERRRHDELPSEGVVPGALQVPASGQPTLFLADCPLTGGYPVIAVVDRADVDRAAQARPGQRLSFVLSRPGRRARRR